MVLLEPLHDRQKKKHTRGTEGVRCHRESRTSGEQRDERDRRCTARTEPQTAELRMGTRALQCRDQARPPSGRGRVRQHAAAAAASSDGGAPLPGRAASPCPSLTAGPPRSHGRVRSPSPGRAGVRRVWIRTADRYGRNTTNHMLVPASRSVSQGS